jgi:3-hydroxyisobutyrate dehydrogenase-like beta-hydroxyacid dehydrogenase
LIDTPVSGSVSTVESGTLTVMVGGDQEALERARPVLDAFAKSIFHLGDVGAGATMKLVVNALVAALNVAVSEALVLAERAGLDRQTVYDVFEASAAGAPYVKYKREAFLRPGEVPVAFSLALTAKDSELIHDLAQRVGARMDQGEASRRLVAEAVALIATFLSPGTGSERLPAGCYLCREARMCAARFSSLAIKTP